MSEVRAVEALLSEAVAAIDAPDVVVAAATREQRTYATGGTAAPPATPREELRYELGSVSKTFSGLLLAELARAGEIRLDAPLHGSLPQLPLRHATSRLITLRHLATHTSGLPRIPLGLVPGALLRPYDNSYARYGNDRLLETFARTRPRSRPGTRWHYSNLGVALLGLALAHSAGTTYAELLTTRVLRPLGLAEEIAIEPGPGGAGPTGSAARYASADARGHRADGRTPVPRTVMSSFVAAGGARATPHGLLSYLESHLKAAEGQSTPEPLEGALRDVQRPLLRRGWQRRHTHTLTWFLHPGPEGPLLFHAGATFGQEAFLGYHPATRTGLAVLATRRDHAARMTGTAYELLHTLARHQAAGELAA
jgi:CubicO group peptidase (beta-lactamase class C family)